MSDLFNPEMGVAMARKILYDESLKAAIKCPCCDRTTKRYEYGLSSGRRWALFAMAKAAREDLKAGGDGWVDSQASILPFREQHPGVQNYYMLRYWGLAEPRDNAEPWEKKAAREEENKVGTGQWRITALGWAWLAGSATVPRKVVIYNATVESVSDERTHKSDMRDCRNFDLDEFNALLGPISGQDPPREDDDGQLSLI